MDAKNPQSLAQKLTPTEIKNKEFSKAMLGYNPKEVVEFLDATAKAWEKVQKNEKELLDKIHSLNDEILRWKGREGEMEKLKERANQEAEAIREEARQQAQKLFIEVEEKANAIRAKTEEWLGNVIAEVSETERQKSNFMTAFKSALDSHYALIKAEQEEGEPLTAKLSHLLKSNHSQSPRV